MHEDASKRKQVQQKATEPQEEAKPERGEELHEAKKGGEELHANKQLEKTTNENMINRKKT